MVLICSDQGGYDQDDGYSFHGECMLCFFRTPCSKKCDSTIGLFTTGYPIKSSLHISQHTVFIAE